MALGDGDELWFPGDGQLLWNCLCRLDGTRVDVYGAADGMPPGGAGPIHSDDTGLLAVGRLGLSRFDGEAFEPAMRWELTKLASHVHNASLDGSGRLWLGWGQSPFYYDHGDTATMTIADGLPAHAATSPLPDSDGNVWFASYGAGLYRYDGASFVTYDTDDGLPGNYFLWGGLEDAQGHLWFGTDGGGLVRCDGQVFQTLTREDGLAGNVARSIVQDEDGTYWIACSGGLTHFTPPAPLPPPIHVDAVVADRRYEQPDSLSVPALGSLTVFEFHGVSLKTRPGAMVYRYRLVGHDDAWRNTRSERVEYDDLPAGEYRFEVLAVDRDLVYSAHPATVVLRVHPPYERYAWVSALLVACVAIAWQTARVVRRDRHLHQANADLTQANEALSDANEELFRVNRAAQETNAELESANREIREATQRKSEFLRRMSHDLRRMSHDLRTPMNAIIGYTRLVLRKAKDVLEGRQIRNLENIQSSAHNLLSLINEILDLSRVEAGRVEINLQEVDLRQLADACADEIASLVPAGVELRRELAAVPVVQTDPEILRKVLMNLLGNALKFTERGAITVAVAPAVAAAPSPAGPAASTEGASAGDQAETAAATDVTAVEIRVSDTGVGIPPEDLPFILEEFRQAERQGSTEKEGTGLGLAIAHKSVGLLGGTLTAESEVGTGTTFILRVGAYVE